MKSLKCNGLMWIQSLSVFMKMFVSIIVAVVSFDLEESFCVLNAVLEAFPP